MLAFAVVFTLALALGALAALFAVREQQFAKERREWIQERSSLLNRIKPETAQVAGLPQDYTLVEPVRSDEDYWAAREDNPYAPPIERPWADDAHQDPAVMRVMSPGDHN